MRRNCRECTRWRPISDFRVTGHRGKDYPSRMCVPCERVSDRERQLAYYYRNHEKMKLRQRNRARQRRREAGTPEKTRYRRTDRATVNAVDTKLDLMLRYGPR